MNHSTRTILLTAVLALGILSVPFIVHSAYDLKQIMSTDNISNQFMSTEAGMTIAELINSQEVASKACLVGSAYDLFKGGLDNKLKQATNAAADLISDAASNALGSLVSCGISKLSNMGMKALTGGLMGGGGPDCVQTVKSDTLAFIKAQGKQTAQQLFLTRCAVGSSVANVGNLVDRMIQEQGPGGAAAWAQNWELSAYIEPDQLAHRRFWSMLVNTDICEYMEEDVLNYFDVPQAYRDNPPNISAIDLRVNAGAPFTLTGACTLPDGYIPGASDAASFIAGGGWALMAQLAEPQNNPQGFLHLAEAELSRQQDAMLDSANTQLIAGGGFLAAYGGARENCIASPDWNGCISYGTIKMAPGAVRDARTISLESQMNFVLNAESGGGTDTAVSDMTTRIQARLLDLANEPLKFQISLGIADNPDNYTPAPTPTPAPGSGAAGDPLCTGGDPQCVCIRNDPGALSVANTVIKSAAIQAVQKNPALFVWGTSEIAPETDRRLVLKAICTELSDATCLPHPTKDDQIVLITGETTAGFNVITPNGFVRTSGSVPMAACTLGVQN